MTALTKAFLGDAVVAGGLVVLAGVDVGEVGTPASLVETTLHSVTLPANALPAAAGKACIRIRAWGNFAGNAHDKTLKLKFGSATLFTFGPSLPADAMNWNMDVVLIGDRVAQGGCTFFTLLKDADGSVEGIPATTKMSDPAQDGTTALAIAVTGQNGTAAAGDIKGQGLIVEYLSSAV